MSRTTARRPADLRQKINSQGEKGQELAGNGLHLIDDDHAVTKGMKAADSAAMCMAHRRAVLERLRVSLGRGNRKTVCVSTQVIEAKAPRHSGALCAGTPPKGRRFGAPGRGPEGAGGWRPTGFQRGHRVLLPCTVPHDPQGTPRLCLGEGAALFVFPFVPKRPPTRRIGSENRP